MARTSPTADRETPLWRLCFGRVVRKRCPQCGVGELFVRYAKLEERCPHCGLIYRREQGAGTGSMYLSATVTEIFTALLIAFMVIGTDWGTATGLAVGIPIVVLFAYAFQPYSMALWVAIEYLTDVGNGDWWAKPRR